MNLDLMIVNLCCSAIMSLCGFWLLTERSMSRAVRINCALVACGGTVNSLGMIAALSHYGGFVYGDIWPGEAIVNVGAAALMFRWTWLSRRQRKGVEST
ncbi:hypothetical protein [Luteibacter sp. E-22]|uniref:hypothetical protein n=1 Tax=Luteibacter sp. E-22 TaxID=3404050 RepID=UPI003CE84C77